MKNIYIKLLTAIILTSSTLNGLSFEHYQLYKDIDVMKMGGVNIGLGGANSALFYNPAGLSKLKASDGFELKLANINLSTNSKVVNLVQNSESLLSRVGDLNGDGESNSEDDKVIYLMEKIESNIGENANFDGSNFSSIGKKIGVFGFSFGFLTALDLNFQPHRGFGSEGLIEVNGLFLNGMALGVSYDISDSFSIGVGSKHLEYNSLSRGLGVDEVLEKRDNFIEYLDKDVAYQGDSTVFDIGMLYRINRYLNFGLSAINIGGIGDNRAVEVPETVNIGIGAGGYTGYKYIPEFRAGIDYMDLTENYSTGDTIKKVRAGVELSIIDTSIITFKVAGGLYQGYYTAGTTLRLTVLQIGFATYAEELGAYSGEREDRRYIVNLSVGW